MKQRDIEPGREKSRLVAFAFDVIWSCLLVLLTFFPLMFCSLLVLYQQQLFLTCEIYVAQ